MNYTDIIELIKAGYTKSEIEALNSKKEPDTKLTEPQAEPQAEPSEPQAEPSEPQAEQSEPQAEPQAEPTEIITALTNELASLKSELAENKKMLQTLAILRDGAPQPSSSLDQATEILANIIRPTKKE